MDVIKTILDACSFFVQMDSKLKEVIIVIWEKDSSSLRVGLLSLFSFIFGSFGQALLGGSVECKFSFNILHLCD